MQHIQTTIVDMLRMSDADLAHTMQAILIAQLKAGHDYFTWDTPGDAAAEEVVYEEPAADHDRFTPEDLAACRIAYGVSQEALARKFGYSAQTISAWERGKKAIPVDAQRTLRQWGTHLMSHQPQGTDR